MTSLTTINNNNATSSTTTTNINNNNNLNLNITSKCILPLNVRNFCPHPFKHQWYITYKQNDRLYLALVDMVNDSIIDFILIPSFFAFDLQIFTIPSSIKTKCFVCLINNKGTVIMFEDKIPNGLTYCRTIKVFKHNEINTKRQFLITMSKNRKQSFCFVSSPETPLIYFLPISNMAGRTHNQNNSYALEDTKLHQQMDGNIHESNNTTSILYSNSRMILYVGKENNQVEVWSCKSLTTNGGFNAKNIGEKVDGCNILYNIRTLVGLPYLLLIDKRKNKLLVFQQRSNYETEIGAFNLPRGIIRSQSRTGNLTPTKQSQSPSPEISNNEMVNNNDSNRSMKDIEPMKNQHGNSPPGITITMKNHSSSISSSSSRNISSSANSNSTNNQNDRHSSLSSIKDGESNKSIEDYTQVDNAIQMFAKGNLINAWIQPSTSFICCLFSDLSCKVIFIGKNGDIHKSNVKCQQLSQLSALIKGNAICIKGSYQKGDTTLFNRSTFRILVEERKKQENNNNDYDTQCCGYILSLENSVLESIVSTEGCPIVSSHSIPFDRYLIKEVDDTNGSKNNYNDNVNVIFADKVILMNNDCRINIYIHSCLTHKSKLIVSFTIENGRNLSLSTINIDKSKEYFLLRLFNLDSSFEEKKVYTLAYGSLSSSDTNGEEEKRSKDSGTSTSQQNPNPEVQIIYGMSDGSFIYSKAGTFLFFLSDDGTTGECVFIKNRQKQTYTMPKGTIFKRIEFAPRARTEFSTSFIIEFYDVKRQCNYIGISSLKKGNTLGIAERVELLHGEKVLDIQWQNNTTFTKSSEQFSQLFNDDEDHKLDDMALKVFNKRYAAILTNRNIIVIDRNCKVFSRIPFNNQLKDVYSISWIGFSIVISQRNSSTLKYVTMRGRILPLCSLLETPSCIKICNVLCDRLTYAIRNNCESSNSKIEKTKFFTRPLLPLEALIVGLIDYFLNNNLSTNSASRNSKKYNKSPISKDASKILFSILKNFIIIDDERHGGIDDAHDGPSEDAGITLLTTATLARAGLEECAMYLFRPGGILPLSAKKLQILPGTRCEVAIASGNMRQGLEELLASETELRDYALNPNAGLSSVGAMPSRYGKLSQYLKSFARASFVLGHFEVAATCLDIAGDDFMLYQLLVTMGKHGSSVLTALLNTITVTSRDPHLKAAINAYMNIHGFSADKNAKSSSSNRRKRRVQTTKELSFHTRELEHYSRRGALLGIGMDNLRLPSWDTKSKTQAKRDELLKTFVPSFDPRNGLMKPLALDTETSWVGEETPNVAEPVKEQRKFGVEDDENSSTGKNGDGDNNNNASGTDRQQQGQQNGTENNAKSPLSTITGGADPERAIVLYLRFEEKIPFEKETIEYIQRDSGPYENNAIIFGSKNNCTWTDEDSPVDDVSRRQHQHILSFEKSDNDGICSQPKGAADVIWGLRLMIADQITLQLGFHQALRHRNHRFATYELWIRKNTNEESVILGLGAGLSKDFQTRENNVSWAWSLIMTETGLRFETSSGSKIAGDSVNDESEQRNISNKWVHVAFSIDALRSPPHVCLYIDGKLIADGSVDEPEGDHKFNSNPTSALYIAPNFIGELTELRVWALVRPQDQIYANREWALKMAKKKRRNRFNNVKIVANNKKTIGGGNNKPLVKLSGLSSGGKSRGRRNRKKKKLQQH